MLIDTHAHLNFAAYVRDRDKVIKKCLRENIWMINIGTNFFTSEKAIEIAQAYESGIYASVGLHPINLATNLVKQKIDQNELMANEDSPFEQEFDYEKYKELIESNRQKSVAIGESGLDYYWRPKTKKRQEEFKLKQKQLFLEELRLAKELDLPIILHCRMAHDDLLEILRQQSIFYDTGMKGVIHCFTGTTEQLQEYLDLGFFIGFNGIVFKMDLKEQIKKTPLEKILLETDCPYLSPPGYNKERNDPLGVKIVAQEIAEIKGISLEDLAEQTTKNAKQLFKI
jgi:TatD DNase family protein